MKKTTRLLFLVAASLSTQKGLAVETTHPAKSTEPAAEALSQGSLEEDDGPESEDFDIGSEEDELGLSQEEIRDNFNYGLGLGFGVSAPWQMVSVVSSFKLSPAFHATLAVGDGSFKTEGRTRGLSYALKTRARTFLGGVRYFPLVRAPFFFESLLGYGAWTGRLSPRSEDSQDQPSEQLSAALKASGVVLGFNLGIVWVWPSGFYIEYSLQRVGAAVLQNKSYSDDSPHARTTIEKAIEDPQSWGFANLRVGWYL